MKNENWKYLYRIRKLEIKSWMKYLMLQGKEVIDYVLGELTKGTDITINNTVEKTFYKFDIKGNSTQNGTPSPETEVPIYSSGDDNSISEKIVNKNLFDKNIGPTPNRRLSTSTGNPYTSNGYSVAQMIEIFPNTVYTLTTGITSQMCWYDKNQTRISGTNWADGTSKTSPANAKYLRFDFQSDNIANVQLELGSTATTYTAHQEQTYTIPVQQPMRSIGTVRDEFVKVNGEWKERHNIAEIIYDGSEDESWNYEDLNSGRHNFYIKLLTAKNGGTYELLNNIGKYANGLSNNYNCYVSNGGNFNFRYDELTSASAFKTFLTTTNMRIIYQLATPQDLPCTAEQISILENLPKSYDEQTNIYSLDVTPAYLEVQAYVKKEGE